MLFLLFAPNLQREFSHWCEPSAFLCFFKFHYMPLVSHLKYTFQVSCTKKLKGICTGDLKSSPVFNIFKWNHPTWWKIEVLCLCIVKQWLKSKGNMTLRFDRRNYKEVHSISVFTEPLISSLSILSTAWCFCQNTFQLNSPFFIHSFQLVKVKHKPWFQTLHLPLIFF